MQSCGVTAYIYNLSYLGGRGRKILVQSLCQILSEKQTKIKRAGSMAQSGRAPAWQGQSPEFKLQYHPQVNR
jgi:hypothetical protein